MYFPVLRAKQNELIAIREIAERVSPKTVRPVFEPVRTKVESLVKTISHLNTLDIEPIIIINPTLGDFSGFPINFLELLKLQGVEASSKLQFLPCFSTKNNNVDLAHQFLEGLEKFAIYLEGSFSKDWLPFIQKAEITLVLGEVPPKLLESAKKIVFISDGFQDQSKNKDYPDVSNFHSNWHSEFSQRKKCIGFGDYTLIDLDYSESGGPAYVVAVHFSYIDTDEFDAIMVKHFKSYDDKSPTMPGVKFKDALDKLIECVSSKPEMFYNSLGLQNFKILHQQNHFPGLGQVKKNSIQHHIEMIANYLSVNYGN
jgi:hypothetical protein